MAGRIPLKDNRRKNHIAFYLTDEELERFNQCKKAEHDSASQAWFVCEIILAYINGELVKRSK